MDRATPKSSAFEPRRPRYTSSSITGNSYSLRRLGLRRLTDVVKRTSGGHWNAEHAKRLLAAAHEAITLWAGGGIDFDELAWDLASEVRVLRQLDDEIGRLDTRITGLYDRADPKGIIRSAPGIGDAAHAAPRVHHRRARRRRPTPRRPRSCVTRRPPNDNALPPFTSLTRPAREIHRVHLHRRRRTMTAQNDWRAAHIQGIRRYLGSDPLGYMTAGWSVPQCLHFVAGSAVD